jgi:uncharacterized membrane protein YdjX (TVP38/TMEM64 family)
MIWGRRPGSILWVGCSSQCSYVCLIYMYLNHSLFRFTEIVSIPPLIGHTTLLNLCGFTYGMKGFLLAAPASLVASTVVFVALRYLFSGVLQSWSRKNETWKALEEVIVSSLIVFIYNSGRLSFRMPKVSHSSFSLEYLRSLHGYIQTLSLP